MKNTIKNFHKYAFESLKVIILICLFFMAIVGMCYLCVLFFKLFNL